MPIKILTRDVAAKIAAGEVVERPISVVKELLENAIDAGAKTVRLEIAEGGKKLIKISDDGCGIPTSEVPLAFERHATSKLSTIEDLFTVRTLGFRGEALASISAVSQLTMTTRPLEQNNGTQIRFEGSTQLSLGPIGSPSGTIITVENLFYNVPARLKFLKADATEAGHIHRIVSHYAMAYPHIKFSLKKDNRQVFQTDGSGNLYDVLVAVWGLGTAKQMIPLQVYETAIAQTEANPQETIQVSGYIGTPALHRGQRDQVVLFINRRWVYDRALAYAVTQAYHTFLPIGRHPIAVLNIDIPPDQVDVNVHPTKSEVKFRDPATVFSAVQRPVRATITDDAPLVREAQSVGQDQDEEAWPNDHESGDFRQGRPGPGLSQLGFEVQRTLPHEQTFGFEGEAEPNQLPPLRLVGQIKQTYIITEGPDGLYLIDQHAAHERILYEKLMAEHAAAAVVSQRLLTPILLELTPIQAAIVEAEQDSLTTVGFELEPFGGHSYRLLALPEMLKEADPTSAFIDILGEMAQGAVPMARETHESIAIIVCKRASIKGGQTLSQVEMQEMIRLLEQSQNPRTCPHGRPTMVHLSAYQLAKEFGRH